MDGARRYCIYIILFSAVGGVLYGYDLGIIAGALLYIHQDIPMTHQQTSFVVAAVLGGGAIATIVSGVLLDIFGRKKMLLAATLIFLSGVYFLSFADTYAEILYGRLLQGVGVGIITIGVPLYLAEILPANIRGRGVSAFQFMLTAGILISALICMLLSKYEAWRMMFLSAGVPGVILLIGCFMLPESPRWLMLKGRLDQARKVLNTLFYENAAKKEFDLIVRHTKSTGQPAPISALFNRTYFLPLMIVFLVAILNQLTGINLFLQYSAVMLKEAGLGSNLGALLGSSAIAGMNLLVTLIALYFVDILGRRKLLIFGTACLIVSLVYCAAVSFMMPFGHVKGVMLLLGLTAFIFSFAIGPGVVIWLVLSELLPTQVRSMGMAIGLFLNSMASSVFAGLFLTLVDYISYAGVFGLCAVFMVLYYYIAVKHIPEAKGKSLEEIQQC